MVDRIDSGKSKQRQSNLGDGRFALGTLAGVLISVVLYFSSSWLDVGFSRAELLDLLPSLIAVGIAFLSLFLAFQNLREQQRLRQAGTDPVILVHLGKREDAPILSTLEITNVGSGAAVNVDYQFSTDISAYVPDRIITDFMTGRYPIRAIPQGRSVSFNFGVGHELLGDDPVPPIEISVSYEDIEGTKYTSNQIIDVRELKGQRADTPPHAQLPRELEKLRRAFERMGTDPNPLRIVCEDHQSNSDRRRRELDNLKAQFEQKQEGA
jgi:hypothetical protein